jgi:hypothetical protein
MTGTAIKGDIAREARATRSGSVFFRVVVTAVALVLWFWSQKLIGAQSTPSLAIVDRLHALTASTNSYLHAHPSAADLLLIVSSGVIDLLGIFLLSRWIIGASLRPFLGLVIVLGLRQTLQFLVSLPPPPDAIWHYPGFPSLLVTYSVSNDYFFSGHTAIAVLAATEISRMGKVWLTAVGALMAVFEITTVLVLRAHYTMDVFTGAVTGLYAAYLAGRIASSSWRERRGLSSLFL